MVSYEGHLSIPEYRNGARVEDLAGGGEAEILSFSGFRLSNER
jgi:hypothetical protein